MTQSLKIGANVTLRRLNFINVTWVLFWSETMGDMAKLCTKKSPKTFEY